MGGDRRRAPRPFPRPPARELSEKFLGCGVWRIDRQRHGLLRLHTLLEYAERVSYSNAAPCGPVAFAGAERNTFYQGWGTPTPQQLPYNDIQMKVNM